MQSGSDLSIVDKAGRNVYHYTVDPEVKAAIDRGLATKARMAQAAPAAAAAAAYGGHGAAGYPGAAPAPAGYAPQYGYY